MRDALPYTHHAVDGVGAQQDKQTKVICRTSTGASSVNLARPKTVAILSHWASTFVELSWQYTVAINLQWQQF